MTTDPLHFAHRVHVSTTDTGHRAHCTCGWAVTRPSREQRQTDIDVRHGIPRNGAGGDPGWFKKRLTW